MALFENTEQFPSLLPRFNALSSRRNLDFFSYLGSNSTAEEYADSPSVSDSASNSASTSASASASVDEGMKIATNDEDEIYGILKR